MSKFWILLLVGLLSGCPPQRTESPTSGTITVAVTESLAPLIQREADEFHRLYPEANVTIVPTSTREAIVHLLNDSLEIIIVDRQFNEEEQSVIRRHDISYVETKIAQDALVVVVHKQNPAETISLRSLKNILTHTVSRWRDVPESRWSGSIDLVLTPRNSGAYELLTTQFFNLEYPVVPTTVVDNQYEALKAVALNPRAIAFISLGMNDTTGRPDIVSYKNATRVLAVSGKDSVEKFYKPHQANVYREYYPLHYPVYLYTTASYASLASGFSAFISSIHGQKIIQSAGLVPATMPIRLVQTTQEPLSR